MSDVNLESLRRKAKQLERNERKGGGLCFELSFDDVLPTVGAVFCLSAERCSVAFIHLQTLRAGGYRLGQQHISQYLDFHRCVRSQ